MNAKKSKKVLLLASLSALAVSTAAVIGISFNSDFSKVRGIGEVVNTSVTFSKVNCTKTGSSSKVSWSLLSEKGTNMVLYSVGSASPYSPRLIDTRGLNDSYGLFVKSEGSDAAPLFRFQYISSVTVVSFQSNDGAQYSIYTDATASGTAVATQTVGANEESHTFDVAGAHYFALKPSNDGKWLAIKSVTINYSCEVGGTGEYSIGASQDVGYTITPSKSSATAGDEVTFSLDIGTGYTLSSVSVKKGSDDVTVSGPVAGEYSFIMPFGDVEISAEVEGLHHIGIGKNSKDEFEVGDSYVKPVVYAYYYGALETPVDVAESDITCTGYNMSAAGNYTVTVSYTDSNSATVTTTYQITVTVPPVAGFSVSFTAFDYGTESSVDLSSILDLENSILPTSCEEGETLQFTLVFRSDFTPGFYAPAFLHDLDYEGFVQTGGELPTAVWEVEMPGQNVTIQIGYMVW